jgi:D-erythronate 2-dehydrogenase
VRPVRVVVTGGAGFLGAALARRLLGGPVAVGGATPAEVARLELLDLVGPPDDVAADPRVVVRTGELVETLAGVADADLVLHLAGVVSGAAEEDFDLGVRVNLDGTRAVLEWCRARPTPPVLVFTSSLAVFGADPAHPPPDVVDDDTMPRPQSSYGVQKYVGEQLVADWTRKGFVRGRSVRLMTVTVRPGRPNAAASSFLSSMVREPVAGERAVVPVRPDLPVALSSPARTLEGILRAAAVDDDTWGSRTAMNMPSLTVTPADMAAALDRAVPGASALLDWQPDPAVEAIVGSWPGVFSTPRAEALGLAAPASFDEVVAEFLAGGG